MSETPARRRHGVRASSVALALGLPLALAAIVVIAVIVATRRESSPERNQPGNRSAEAAVAHDHPQGSAPPLLQVETSPGVHSRVAREAEILVKAFIEHLRHDDIEEAMQFWSGYPDMMSASRSAVRRALQDLGHQHEWLVGSTHYEVLVTRPAGATGSFVVVTVMPVPRPGAAPRDAVAFVVGEPLDGSEAAHGHMVIHRLPDAAVAPSPRSGSEVRPGDEVVIPHVPVDGDAVAHAGTAEMLAVVRPGGPRPGTALTVPEGTTDHLVITLSLSAPEVPMGFAFVYPIAAR